MLYPVRFLMYSLTCDVISKGWLKRFNVPHTQWSDDLSVFIGLRKLFFDGCYYEEEIDVSAINHGTSG